MLDEGGQIQLEQRVHTSANALREVFGAMPRSRIALETGTHSPWTSRLLGELGPRSDRGERVQGATLMFGVGALSRSATQKDCLAVVQVRLPTSRAVVDVVVKLSSNPDN